VIPGVKLTEFTVELSPRPEAGSDDPADVMTTMSVVVSLRYKITANPTPTTACNTHVDG
jgi:hypothetical protein